MNIDFIKSVAKDHGIEITDEQAKKAHEVVSEEFGTQDYYYGLKEYFSN